MQFVHCRQTHGKIGISLKSRLDVVGHVLHVFKCSYFSKHIFRLRGHPIWTVLSNWLAETIGSYLVHLPLEITLWGLWWTPRSRRVSLCGNCVVGVAITVGRICSWCSRNEIWDPHAPTPPKECLKENLNLISRMTLSCNKPPLTRSRGHTKEYNV